MAAIAAAAFIGCGIDTAAAVEQADPGWKPVETLQLSGPDGRQHYNLTVERDETSDASPRLRIMGQRGTGLIVQPAGGLMKAEEALSGSQMPRNALGSAWAYASPALIGAANERLLLIFGHAFASEPGSISVVVLGGRGAPRLAYSDDTFQVQKVIHSREGLTLVGRRSLTQLSGNCRATYDPYALLRFSGDGDFKYSASLSRTHNLTHGYVWAGPHGREDVTVDQCANPKRLLRSRLTH